MLVGGQCRRTDRARPTAQGMRKRAVENGPAVRASDAFELRMTLACLAIAGLGDRRARGQGEHHKEQPGRTGVEEARGVQKTHAVSARSCPPPR